MGGRPGVFLPETFEDQAPGTCSLRERGKVLPVKAADQQHAFVGEGGRQLGHQIDEGVAVESVFLDSTHEGDFLVYFMKAQSLSAASEAAQRSSHPIDAYHAQFKAQTWESQSFLDLLVDFENFA